MGGLSARFLQRLRKSIVFVSISEFLQRVCERRIFFTLADLGDQFIQEPFVATGGRAAKFLDDFTRELAEPFRIQRHFGGSGFAAVLVVVGEAQVGAHLLQKFVFAAGLREEVVRSALHYGAAIDRKSVV